MGHFEFDVFLRGPQNTDRTIHLLLLDTYNTEAWIATLLAFISILTMMTLLPRRLSSLPLLLATLALSCNGSSNNAVAVVSAFAPSITPRQPCTNNNSHALPNVNVGVGINSPATTTASSIRNRDTKLYNLFTDAVGGLLNGPALEAETDLPYDPPFAEDVSIADHTRTFAIKERP